MALEITRKGYIEVWSEDGFISRHVSEWEAIESISEQEPGRYEVRFPLIEVVALETTQTEAFDVTVTNVLA